MSTAVANPARELLARVLSGVDLEAEYPLVFGERPAGEVVALEMDGDVRAACATLARDFVVGPRTLRGGLIGSVSTDSSWRRQGLGTRLLERAEEHLRAEGCLFSLLWAESPDFYLRRGYAPCGMENDFALTSDLVELLPRSEGIRPLQPEDAAHLLRLHRKHSTRVERSLDEMRSLLAVPGMTTLVLERPAAAGTPAQPQAYACLGRGRDLPDSIHDWAGDALDVMALLRAHLERRFGSSESGLLFLMGPPAASDLAYRLTRLGVPSQRGILGLGKILDLEGAARHLAEVLEVPGCVQVEGDALTVTGPGGSAQLDRDLTLAVLIGAPDVRDDVRSLLARLGFDRVALPLQPFAWGLDSI
jgi:GNAT superfamily N-acetyltransferase